MPSKYLWLFDNGHGGIINGQYVTPGKRSPVWQDGRQLFEGVFNREIVSRLVTICEARNIDCVNIVPESEDVSLRARVKRANDIYKDDERCIYISIHANAGGGTGWECFTSVGDTKSDRIATIFYGKAEAEFPNMRMRKDTLSDGDPDKEEDFYVLRNTLMPAILTENFFMDTLNPDCEILLSEEGKDRIARFHFEAILEVEERI